MKFGSNIAAQVRLKKKSYDSNHLSAGLNVVGLGSIKINPNEVQRLIYLIITQCDRFQSVINKNDGNNTLMYM